MNEECFAIFCGHWVEDVTTRPAVSGESKLWMTVKIEGADCRMEVDTESSKSIVS